MLSKVVSTGGLEPSPVMVNIILTPPLTNGLRVRRSDRSEESRGGLQNSPPSNPSTKDSSDVNSCASKVPGSKSITSASVWLKSSLDSRSRMVRLDRISGSTRARAMFNVSVRIEVSLPPCAIPPLSTKATLSLAVPYTPGTSENVICSRGRKSDSVLKTGVWTWRNLPLQSATAHLPSQLPPAATSSLQAPPI
eukprot:780498-Rhodomonas_salina.1